MNKILPLVFAFLTLTVLAQKNPNKEAEPIVAEGKLLYQSEMASWYGTDLFVENYKNRENIGGYFSYTENGISKCVFFSKSDHPKAIGTISFDDTYNLKTAKIDLTERDFTKHEDDIYQIRKLALDEINADKTLFKQYENSNLNLIPLIDGKEKKVYVLTGPNKGGVVLFGNDYLLTFDKNNTLVLKKSLHKNLIPINYGVKDKDGKPLVSEEAMHSHLPETGDFITATDICTLMLYAKFAKWKTHTVVSKKYMNTWNCTTNELTVIPRETAEKISQDQTK